jgi:hypothetical protein
MHRKCLLAIAMAMLLADPAFADPAFADLVGSSSSPSFTQEEQVIIDRNPSLLEASRSNPWIVRRILDALEKVTPGVDDKPSPTSGDNRPDPDLDRMQRASPEAVHDLFQLLKQAGKAK